MTVSFARTNGYYREIMHRIDYDYMRARGGSCEQAGSAGITAYSSN
jgi:hypothetical protein